MPTLPMLVAAVTGVAGLVVGSFLNVVIYRLPIMLEREWRRQSREILREAEDAPAAPAGGSTAARSTAAFNLLVPQSACPACEVPIKARHNIPLLSYAWLKGRCAACGVRIPVRYPVVEAVTGLLSALVAWRFGVTLEGAAALLLCWSLIALAAIDLNHHLLPDAITLPLLWLGLGFSLVSEPLAGMALFPDPRSSIIGALAGYLSLWSVYQGFKLFTGKEGMGYGDFKLFAALGAWLGWQMLPVIILMSAVVGAVTGLALIVLGGRNRQAPIPFGPYLAAAGFVAMMWGPDLMAAYWQASGL